MKRQVAALTLVALTALCTQRAWAGDSTTDIALTLNPIFGTHRSFNDKTTPPPVPVPLLELRHRSGPLELILTGLPPLGSVRSNDGVQGRTSTSISIFDGTARVWDPLHRFSIGVGQTLYNQSTHYLDGPEIPGVGDTQYSRITGGHYELGYHVPVRGNAFEATFSVAPRMRGTQFTAYDIATIPTRVDPEIATQIDTAIRFVHRAGKRSEILYGLRYVNYTARYDERSGTLSDRNCGLLPVFGYRVRLGG